MKVFPRVIKTSLTFNTKIRISQKQPPELFYNVLKNIAKFTGVFL